MLLTTLLFSMFVGFHGRTTGGFFVPSLRFATASVLCDGELDQRLPVSNKRLNLYCNPADGDEPYAVGFMPYLDARGLRRRLPHRESGHGAP